MYFDDVDLITCQGPHSKHPMSYRYYDAGRMVMGKTMEEHLRPAMCWWHTLCWQGDDAFGGGVYDRVWLRDADPMQCARNKVDAGFEILEKLGLPFFTFHDRDLAPEGLTLNQTQYNLMSMVELLADKMQDTGKQLLWGTANLFNHRRYLAGAATNPNPEVFLYACMQVKMAMDATHHLGGDNYVLWGGREGYDTLLNTDLKQETDQFGRFLTMVADYKQKIGFKGQLLIEPKPCEPTKHQYDYDSGHVFAFLQKYGLEKEFKVNIEANHATLAGHSFAHEIAYACANGIMGSVDANTGDPQLGWDTDQFPMDVKTTALVMYHLVRHGGLGQGGFNFDAKLRRQSIDHEDIFYGFIAGLDTLAQGLLVAEKMIAEDHWQQFKDERYAGWHLAEGKQILAGDFDLAQCAQIAEERDLDPAPVSGHQELMENYLNAAVAS
ncbi:MAG: xylose isomerase [Coxiellaceae bacterium]|nr:xylose isomerase [Coxiellaceae bacterium]